MSKPDKIRIPYLDFEYRRFDQVGKLPDGTQFICFLTGAYPAGYIDYPGSNWRKRKKWLAGIHLVDEDGNHIGSKTRLGGHEIEGRLEVEEKAERYQNDMLVTLSERGPYVLCDIFVRPFSVEIDDVLHGLIYGEVEWESEYFPDECEIPDDFVMLQPQDIMFHPPWDSGEYST